MLFEALPHMLKQTLTNEAKNVPDGGNEDDQGVGAGQQDHSDDGVANPAEVLGSAQELVDRGTDLWRERRSQQQNSSDGEKPLV